MMRCLTAASTLNMLKIPDTALSYILLQRTDIQLFNPLRYPIVRRVPIPYEETLLHLEASCRKRSIAKRFTQSLQGDYEQIRQHLPARAGNILDIGCGVAGIDVMLFKHYQRCSDISFHLLDRTEMNPESFRYGMGDRNRFYNSLEVAREVMQLNGVPPSNIHLVEAAPTVRLDQLGRFELIISLISWGFHYPLGTYLDGVFTCLQPSGRLIVDVRANTAGGQLLSRRFSTVELIHAEGEQQRFLAIK